MRLDLSPSERAAHMAERKRIYEVKYPETVHGGDRRSSRQVGDLKADRFTSDTAKKTGQSERKVQRDAQRGDAAITAAPQVIDGFVTLWPSPKWMRNESASSSFLTPIAVTLASMF
jgi:hypothetical protein